MIPDSPLTSTSAAAGVAAAFCLLLNPIDVNAQTLETAILPEADLYHVDQALHLLNMDRRDLEFERDIATNAIVLEPVRRLLNNPLELPKAGDHLLAAVADHDVPMELVHQWLDLTAQPERETIMEPAPSTDQTLSPKFNMILEAFVSEASRIRLEHDKAIPLKKADKERLAGEFAATALKLEDSERDRVAFLVAGMPQSELDRLLADSRNPDPEPSTRKMLALLDTIDQARLVTAGYDFYAAVKGIAEHLRGFAKEDWPKEVIDFQLKDGKNILIGTHGNDRYSTHALLIIDPGGDDTYQGQAAAVGVTSEGPLAAVIDLGGDDTYKSDAFFGAGSAFLGSTVIMDYGGDDQWTAAHIGQASAYGGCAFVIDHDGHDRYQARTYAQASAIYGVSVLADHSGSDRYDLGVAGQAYSGYRGVALLIDREGNDVYYAGGEQKDYGRHDDRYLTLAQGFSIGIRPFVGGGWAALVDLGGNDTYKADIYGQGVSYWYSVGMLLDRSGNDTYSMHQYGQGSGIHLSLGLLVDFQGQDTYTSYVLAQGNAHDYAVGMLFDHEGDDTYTADHHSQGRALNNAFGLLLDRNGNDAYFGRQPAQCQGVGNGGGHRRYGSLGMLLDLAGRDRYSSGAQNDASRLRPLYGIIYDQESTP